MSRYLRVEGSIQNAKSPNGTSLGNVATTMLLVMASVTSIAVVVSRDHNDASKIKAMALMATMLSGDAIPFGTLADMDDPVKLVQFQNFVVDVVTRASGPNDVEVITVTSF